VELVTQLVDHGIDRARHIGLHVDVFALAEDRQGFPVIDCFGIGKSGFARCAQLVRPAEVDGPRHCDLQLLVIFGDHLENRVVGQ